MSRRGLGALAGLALFAAGIGAGGAAAQQASDPNDPADGKIGGMIDRAKAAYGPLAPQRKTCRNQDNEEEIVVCAPDEGKQWRVPSTNDTDPTSRQATRTGVPRAPQLDRGSCKGKGQLGCFGVGRTAAPMYMIDLKTIPETPKNSDAERVANGEMSDR